MAQQDDVNNMDRIRWAKNALTTFTVETFQGGMPDDMHEDDLECAIVDLIADLLLLAEARGYDSAHMTKWAVETFNQEA